MWWFPFVFYLIFTLGFWGDYPALDAMVIYRESTQFFVKGFSSLIELSRLGYPIHPPLINIITSIGFFFNKSPYGYNLFGTFIYLISLFSFWQITRQKLPLLLFCHPLIILNYFWLGNDTLVLSLVIIATNLFALRQFAVLSFFLTLFPLAKETALLFPPILFIYLLVSNQVGLKKSLLIFLPLSISFLLWRLFLFVNFLQPWHDPLFISQNISSFQILLNNIARLNLINQFTRSNIFNLLILNSNYTYFLLALILIFLYKAKKIKPLFYPYLIFAACYFLFVYSYPTWTVPRYAIPLLPLPFLIISELANLKIIRRILFFTMLLTLVHSSFFSADPLTRKYHPNYEKIYNQTLYSLPFFNNGPDRVAYNRQIIVSNHFDNMLLDTLNHISPQVVITDCIRLKLGERLWSITQNNQFYPRYSNLHSIECLNYWDMHPKIDLYPPTTKIAIEASAATQIANQLGGFDFTVYHDPDKPLQRFAPF